MAVANQTPYKVYIGNGTTKIFPLEFDCDDADHLIVKVNDIEVPALNNWSLNTNTGSVVFAIAPITQSKIILQRDTPLVRDTDYQTYNNSFRPQPINEDLDKIIRILQEQGYTDKTLINDLANEIYERSQQNAELKDQINNHSLSLATIQMIQSEESRKRAQGDAESKQFSKDYTDTIIRMNNTMPILFDGIADNIVMTEEGDTQREKNRFFANSFHFCVQSIQAARSLTLKYPSLQLANFKDYRNGGVFIADFDDKTSLDDGVFTIISASGVRYKRQMPDDGSYQIDWWMDPLTDADDYSLVINKCSAYFDPGQGKDNGDIYQSWDWTGKIKLCPYNVTIVGSGGTRKCVSDIILNAWTNSWDFKCTNLDFSSVTTSGHTHLWIKKANATSIKNLTIRGAFLQDDIILNSDNTLKEIRKLNVGLLLHTNAPNIDGVPCRGITFDGVHLDGVARPIQYGNNAYIHSWNNGSIKHFYEALSLKSDLSNTGENIKFNSVHMTDGFRWAAAFLEAKYKNCSFDYTGAVNTRLQKAFEGKALFAAKGAFSECHFETGNMNSRWTGSWFGGDVQIKDSVLWLAETDSRDKDGVRYCSFNSFINASGVSTIDGLDVANADLNGEDGCWMAGGGSVSLKNIIYPKGLNQWANFYIGEKRQYADFACSVFSGLYNPDDTINEIARYKARYKLKEYLPYAASRIGFDATAHTIILNTTSKDINNEAGFYLYAPIEYMKSYKAAACIFSFARTQDLSDYEIIAEIHSVVISNGSETVLDRITWRGSAKANNWCDTGFTSQLNPANHATHLRLFVCAQKFYTTADNKEVSINIRCPRMFVLTTNGFTTAKTH